MTIDFKLPELGENIQAADVVQILVAEGDRVEVEQIVMELETEAREFGVDSLCFRKEVPMTRFARPYERCLPPQV